MGPSASPHNFFNEALKGVGYTAPQRNRDAENDARNQAADDQRRQDALQAQQAAQVEQLRIDTLQQPKKITPDNFMAQKAKQLAQLRLGMNSTMTGAGNPTLQPAPAALKSKMGA